jgi:hypothetical protein
VDGGDSGLIEEGFLDTSQLEMVRQVLLHAVFVQALQMRATEYPGGIVGIEKQGLAMGLRKHGHLSPRFLFLRITYLHDGNIFCLPVAEQLQFAFNCRTDNRTGPKRGLMGLIVSSEARCGRRR